MMNKLIAIIPYLLLLCLPSQAAPTHHGLRHRHRAHHVRQSAAHAASVTVWVNTNSGVYHYPGERWYGNTEEGEYMSEDAAKKAGYRATENGQ